MTSALNNAVDRVRSWWFEPVPLARIAVLRAFVYGFVFLDLFVTSTWGLKHAHVPGRLYEPLVVARFLHVPTPTFAYATAVEIALAVAALVALTGKWPRLAGGAVFVLYLLWMFIAMSYGKVDHDRVAYLVALAVLPTVGVARVSDDNKSDAAGWALACVQIAVMLTYFLAAFAKLRFGGIDWVNSATLMRPVLRRGTFVVDPLAIQHPWILHGAQWIIMGFELASPLMLLRNKLGRFFVCYMFTFHLVTYAAITIIFFPHCIAMLSYLPLERVVPRALRERSTARTPQPLASG